MRVMPSVTDTIVPTLRASVTDLKPSIRCLMRSLISLALMAMRVFPRKICLGGQLVGDALEPPAERAVDHQVAGAQHGAADQRRISHTLQSHGAAQSLLEGGSQAASLRIVERSSGGDG